MGYHPKFQAKIARRSLLSGAALAGAASLARPAAPADEAGWAAIRAQFLFEPGHIYMNNASLGTPPKPVVEAVAAGYQSLAANPTAAKAEFFRYLETRVIPGVALLLGVGPSEIALTKGASEGLHMIANGIDLEPGDEVVTTSQEHPGGITPWLVRAERAGIVIRQVPMPSPLPGARQVVDLMRDALGPRTKVLFFCQITRGGLLYPVKELCALARSRGIISAVDGAQAVGMMRVDLRDLGCDLYAASLHKWLLAPAGNGVLYVRRDFQPRFRSLYKLDSTERVNAGHYEMLGTYHFPVRAATGAALEFIDRVGGIRTIESHDRMLSDYLKAELAKIPDLKLASSRSPEVSAAGITMFELAGWKAPELLQRLLERHRIHVDEHQRDGHDAIRVSTHYYNSRADVDRLVEALRGLAA